MSYSESRQPAHKDLTIREATEELLPINTFQGQRKPDQKHIQFYRENMENKTQRRLEIAVTVVKATGMRYLMNGQHVLMALLEYGKSYPAAISYFTCDTQNDAVALFATFDVHREKTEKQFMSSARFSLDDERLRTVQKGVMHACGSALHALGDQASPVFGLPSRLDKLAKTRLVTDHPDDVLFAEQFNTSAPHMRLVPVVTAMMVTRRLNAEAAADFWPAVATGEDLKASDPRKKLRDTLMTKSGIDVKKGVATTRALYIHCIMWWNAWRTGKLRKTVRCNADTEFPKAAA